ncbi:hypothetical protein B566_EDAN015430 [Ephemera danica]|nr:hypothetical protein B566_EDAN015430 [Ephemera danica]
MLKMKRFAPQDYPRCCVVGCNSSFRQRVKNKNLHFYRLGPIRKQSHESFVHNINVCPGGQAFRVAAVISFTIRETRAASFGQACLHRYRTAMNIATCQPSTLGKGKFLKWVKASNSQRTLGDNDRVCSKHFTEADFEDRDMLQRRLMPAENFIRGPCLKDSAVPHVNLQSTQRTNIETHNNITMTPAPDAFDISDSAMFDVSPTMEVFKSTPKKQQQCNFRDAATQQHKHQSPHLEPGLSSCSRASVASTLQNSASTPIRVATCPLPKVYLNSRGIMYQMRK